MMVDFDSWQKHVTHVVNEHGRWYGLGDGDGNPIMDLPAPLVDGLQAPQQWMNPEDIALTIPAAGIDGDPHMATRMVILDAMRGFDVNGQLEPPATHFTLLTAMRGKDGGIYRNGGVIMAPRAVDTDNDGVFDELTLTGVNSLEVWQMFPAVSWPGAWWAARPYPRTSDESGLEYSRPWDMARVEMATRITFTWKHGQAGFVIRRLAQESLDAALMTQQDPDGTIWVDDPYHVVEVPEVDNTPEISLDARDGSLWDTVVNQAQNAGLILTARYWWPGDPPVRCWSPANSTMDPAEVDISPSTGAPTRTLGYRSFSHPMIILEVKEV